MLKLIIQDICALGAIGLFLSSLFVLAVSLGGQV